MFAWNANLATDEALQIVLTPTVGTTSASLAGTNIDNGYYKCRIQFKENGTPIVSTVDALRVVSNYTSVETYTLDHQLDGLAVLEVTKEPGEPARGGFLYRGERKRGSITRIIRVGPRFPTSSP